MILVTGSTRNNHTDIDTAIGLSSVATYNAYCY